MRAGYSLEALCSDVANSVIDTVIVAIPDMQGRLMGKRLQAEFFVSDPDRKGHCCNYLLATDLEMNTVPGYRAVGWSQGYGDYVMQPDIATLRKIPWQPGTALVLCDLLDPATGAMVPHAPRTMLRQQIARLEARGLSPIMASELEFHMFDQSYEAARCAGYRGLKPGAGYNQDYHVFQATKDEDVLRAIRTGLEGADIAVESSKGEASPGQSEINVRYAPALTMADRHAVLKNACKEIAWSKGKSVSFLAKWHGDAAGSSAHVHQSLVSTSDERAAFFEPENDFGMSDVMRHYLAGQIEHTSSLTYFLAPYVNSYKRFIEGSFAPTRSTWAPDRRSAGYRVCAAGEPSVRIECRIGGSDLNPYLAFAALIAAGLDGIERQLELGPAADCPLGTDVGANQVPRTLHDAATALDRSAMLRSAFGDDVVDHYVRAARWEQDQFDRQVTDWEVAHGFELA